MKDTVFIKEGGLTKKAHPIDRLKINNTDDTDSLWIPKDDMQTGVLYASQNGIYIASQDGYDAYDEVVVRIQDDFSTDYKDIVPDSSWDSDTYNDYLNNPDAFNDTFNDPSKWNDDYNSIDYNYDDKISGIKPDSGKIKGLDNNYAVSSDNGFLNEELIPSYIKVMVPPNKTSYMHNERIDFTGMVVKAYTNDDRLWTNEKYPDGIIPFEELALPVQIADANEANRIKYASSDLDIPNIIQPIPCGNILEREGIKITNFGSMDHNVVVYDHRIWRGDSSVFFTCSDYSQYLVASDKVNDIYAIPYIYGEDYMSPNGGYAYYNENDFSKSLYIYEEESGVFGGDYGHGQIYTLSYTRNGKTVYYYDLAESLRSTLSIEDYYTFSPMINGTFYSDSRRDERQLNLIAWTMVYGDKVGGVQKIPVGWFLPGAGGVTWSEFYITVGFPNETLPDDDWNNPIDPEMTHNDESETPEGEVNP